MPQPRSCPISAFSLLNEGWSCVWPCFWTQALLTDLGTSCHTVPLTESCLTQGQQAPKTSHRGALSLRGSSPRPQGTLLRAGPLLPLVRPPPPAATAAFRAASPPAPPFLLLLLPLPPRRGAEGEPLPLSIPPLPREGQRWLWRLHQPFVRRGGHVSGIGTGHGGQRA